ncbi:PspC family transcriptional regulator [Enterococcus florum]|uniref:PspC family transcriptional regulator n=1 Tax=Enterococcus florum TaxID=2480627 RepID=A0A4V0WPD0_9ENTE|nr:PspC domain-containing protein [Enterococcus florum]GCF93429.1 PspC family transcriptional regulator [Enterococcus florum]
MQKRLTKSRSNVVLTGTLAGIAEYFGIDPTIVRVIYVFLSFGLLGSPVLLYILMALLMPSGTGTRPTDYGRTQSYKGHNYKKRETKKAEKIDEDDWSDF